MLDRTAEPELIASTQPSQRAGQADATTGCVRTASIAMTIALGLMALFNSDELRSWSRDLPDNAVSDRLIVFADRWHDAMLALGPARVRPALRDVFEAARALRW